MSDECLFTVKQTTMDSGMRVAVSEFLIALSSPDSKSTIKLGGLKRGSAVLMMKRARV